MKNAKKVNGIKQINEEASAKQAPQISKRQLSALLTKARKAVTAMAVIEARTIKQLYKHWLTIGEYIHFTGVGGDDLEALCRAEFGFSSSNGIKYRTVYRNREVLTPMIEGDLLTGNVNINTLAIFCGRMKKNPAGVDKLVAAGQTDINELNSNSQLKDENGEVKGGNGRAAKAASQKAASLKTFAKSENWEANLKIALEAFKGFDKETQKSLESVIKGFARDTKVLKPVRKAKAVAKA